MHFLEVTNSSLPLPNCSSFGLNLRIGNIVDEGALPPPPGPETPIAESPDDAAHPPEHPHHHTPYADHVAAQTTVAATTGTAASSSSSTTSSNSSSPPITVPTTPSENGTKEAVASEAASWSASIETAAGIRSSSSTSFPAQVNPTVNIPLSGTSEAGFLPPSPETAHVPLPLSKQLFQASLVTSPMNQGPLPAFEFRALEAILRYTLLRCWRIGETDNMCVIVLYAASMICV
jgi:hypothetical protein